MFFLLPLLYGVIFVLPWTCRLDCKGRGRPWWILRNIVLPEFRGERLVHSFFHLEGISSAIEREMSSLLELITTLGGPWWSRNLPLKKKEKKSLDCECQRRLNILTCTAHRSLPAYHSPSLLCQWRPLNSSLVKSIDRSGHFVSPLACSLREPSETLWRGVPSKNQSSSCFSRRSWERCAIYILLHCLRHRWLIFYSCDSWHKIGWNLCETSMMQFAQNSSPKTWNWNHCECSSAIFDTQS